MATKAYHKLGDISRDNSDLCIIFRSDKNNYYGNWVTGYGFIDVRFPKETTKKLTKKDKKRFIGVRIQLGGYIYPAFTEKDFEK